MAALTLAACGSSTGTGANGSAPATAASKHGFWGLQMRPAKPAPGLSLRNYTGRRVSLSSFRGKAVLVTFVYTHCPDVCPVIVSKLAAADRQLGADARDLKIIAVTVDPRRDTPRAVRSFLVARHALGRMDYLLGGARQLRRVWKAWDVGVSVDEAYVRGGHTAIVYGVSATGKIEDAYPGNFSPAQIVHDVPLLARG